jgi:ABC-type branched-subunit amino acid transport system substrate-binding protein
MTMTHPTRRQLVLGTAAAVGSAWVAPLRAQDGEILIGQSAPQTGPVAVAFQSPLAGARLAFDEINRKGGINGRRIRLVLLDDAYDTKRTVENVRQLVEQEKVVALTGLGSTAGVAAILPYIAEKRMPLVGVYTGAHVLRLRHHPTLFTTQASFKDEVEHQLRTLVTLKMDKIGVAFQDNEFGKLMMPVVEAAAKELGATLVATAPLAVDGSTSAQAADAIVQARPMAVLLIAVGPSVVGFVKAAKAGLNVPIYTLSVAASAVPALGADARGLVMTQIVPYPWRQVHPMARDFNREAAAADVAVNYNSYGGYLAARFLIEVLRRAAPNISSDNIIRTIQGIRNFDLGGTLLNFSPTNHHGTNWVEITIVGPDGRFMR